LILQTENTISNSEIATHNFDPIFRDLVNAVYIGEREKTYMDIVSPSIVLHDIGFLYNSDPSVHHLVGAQK